MATNAFTSIVVAVLVTLSVILTTADLFPGMSSGTITSIMAICAACGIGAAVYAMARRHRKGWAGTWPIDRTGRQTWRMPPLAARPTHLHRPQGRPGRSAHLPDHRKPAGHHPDHPTRRRPLIPAGVP
jgi:hypothetical protein